MKNKCFPKIISCILLLCLLAAPMSGFAAARKTLTVTVTASTYQNRARDLVKAINKYRKANGLAEYIELADLEKVAMQRAAEVFVLYDHTRPNLDDYSEAIKEFSSLEGYVYTMECIAAGFEKKDDLFENWQKNAADALLDTDMTHIGIACLNVEGSSDEYYWCMYLAAYPEGTKSKTGNDGSKANTEKSFKVSIASGMYERADNTHRKFEMRVGDISLKNKTTAKPTVYLYDRNDVKIGKCNLEDLSFSSSNSAVFTVNASGEITRKKEGTATLTVKSTGLENATCTVTCGNSATTQETAAATTGKTATANAEIKGKVPTLTAKPAAKYCSLSASLASVEGFVLYRCDTKTGEFKKVDEAEASRSCTFKIQYQDMEKKAYYYKVRAYVVKNGKRVYSEYSEPVKVDRK